MGLSSYCTLAFDKKGKSSYGVLNGFSKGTSVQIYKNWIYVRDPRMHFDKGPYTDNVVASIEKGHLHLSEFQIYADRSKIQNAVFVLTQTKKWSKDYKKSQSKLMAGIGAYAFESQIHNFAKDMGVNMEDWDDISQGWCSSGHLTLHCINDKDYKEFQVNDTPENKDRYEPKLVGVKIETYKEFLIWLEEIVKEHFQFDKNVSKWLNEIKRKKLEDILCYNQGDAFFSDAGIFDSNIGFPLENPVEPLLTKSLKESKEENERVIEEAAKES